MPRPKKGEQRMNFQTVVRLPDEWGEELKLYSDQTSVPPAVLARQWLIEKLRDVKHERELREQHRPHDWA